MRLQKTPTWDLGVPFTIPFCGVRRCFPLDTPFLAVNANSYLGLGAVTK